MNGRAYDVALLGATGFTGRLTAAHLAAHAPDISRIALAGRDPARVSAVRDQVAPGAGVVVADVEDPRSLRELAASSRVVASTVGPYLQHGEPLVAACAAEGTGYLDLTGEPEFVDRMWLAHNETAQRTGARLVHACGFDSIPHDLGAYHCVLQLPEDVPLTVRGYVRGSGMFSGGTWHSAIGQMARPRQMAAAGRDRRAREPRPEGRRTHIEHGRPRREPAVGTWAWPLPTVDPQVITRSARALPRYGPEFTYGHYAAMPLPVAAGLGAGIGAVAALAQVPPARALLLKARAPGSGPSAERIERGWFEVRFVGEGGGRRVVTRVRGGDPGYGDTAKMLGQAALCLALDDLPETAGQVTTAQAMGDALLARLQAVGISFEVVDDGS